MAYPSIRKGSVPIRDCVFSFEAAHYATAIVIDVRAKRTGMAARWFFAVEYPTDIGAFIEATIYPAIFDFVDLRPIETVSEAAVA